MEVVIKKDKDGNEKSRTYRIKQGEVVGLIASIQHENEGMIDSFMFRLGLTKCECKLEYVFSQDFILDSEGRWVLQVDSEVTSNWQPSCGDCGSELDYVYEVWAVFSDGNKECIREGKFIVDASIGGVA